MPRRICIIQGHPDSSEERLLRALANAYALGATTAGHEVRSIEVARLDFPLLRTQGDFESGAVPASLETAEADMRWAEHWVLLFPLWLGTMPALLKGFLEQTMRPGQAFAYTESAFPKRLLAGRSARVVITMGMPALVYRWYFGAHGLRGLEASILKFVGINPVRDTLFGGVGTASADKRASWIEQMRALGARAA